MFHVVYILNSGHEQFGDFWSCLGIFSNSTKLQKIIENRNKKEREGTNLAAHQPAHLAGPAQQPLQRAACLRQAGRQVLDGGTSARHAVARRPASSPRLSAGLDELHVVPRTPWTPHSLTCLSPSLSHTMADATAAAPSL